MFQTRLKSINVLFQTRLESIKKLVYCKGCKQNYSYAGWADHCLKHHFQHSKMNGEAHADDGDEEDDVVSRSKLQPKATAAAKKKPQPKAKAGAKKTGCLKKGPPAKKKTSQKGS